MEVNVIRSLQIVIAIALGAIAVNLQAHDGKLTFAPVLKEVSPAVVNISVEVQRQANHPLFNDPMFRRYFRMPDQDPQPRQSVGSGVIIDADAGYVVTNHHVVNGAQTIMVTLQDRREVEAKLVGSDEKTDIALLEIDADDIRDLDLGDSEALEVGDFVIAIGNPFSLGHTVTSGIVSALGRQTNRGDAYEDYIQTDASINPGNSGGALVDLDGRLVGINTMIYTTTGGNVGIGFAVPTTMVRGVVDQLIEFGEVRRGVLGVIIGNVDPNLVDALELANAYGALVSEVMPGSAAERAGVEAGDVIVRVNDEAVESMGDLRNAIGLLRIGDDVSLELIRDGKRLRLRANVGAAPNNEVAGVQTSPKLEGAVFGVMTGENRELGLDGVEVRSVENSSRAWGAGLRPGDVVLSVNRRRVTSVDEFNELVQNAGRALAFSVQRGSRRLFVVVP